MRYMHTEPLKKSPLGADMYLILPIYGERRRNPEKANLTRKKKGKKKEI